MSNCILCPGQGAQHVGMGKDYADAHPAAKAVYNEANDVLGVDLATFCFEGPEEQLNQTDIAQPAIFATSIACHAAAQAADRLPSDVTSYAGLSLGEYTALYLAGCFDFATGLKLVQARGRYMQEAAVSTPGGMVSLLGVDENQASDLCERAAAGEVLVPANYNCPGQIVCSGAISAVDRLAELAGEQKVRAVKLAVAGAFHSPLMQPAADRLADDLAKVDLAAPATPVWANVTAEPHGNDVATIKKLLVQQVVEPVRWQQTIEKLVGDDAAFTELAPGRVLAGLLKKVDRRATMTNLGSAEALVS
ncbi:MAG: ACP S-malonyltransferase [Planctomycetota bacterium]